jgi:ribosomal 50S subunit-recycling heat shock protein
MYATRADMILKSSLAWSLGPLFTYAPLGGGATNGGNGGGTGAGGTSGGATAATGTNGGTNGGTGTSGTGGKGCFPAGTHISTPQGTKTIESLHPDDEVLAVDEQGRSHAVTVKTFMTKRAQILTIETDGGRLHTTDEHPIMLANFTFRPASELKINDRIMFWENNKPTPVKIRALKHKHGRSLVYNLEVGEPHTFIADGFVVHNKKATPQVP